MPPLCFCFDYLTLFCFVWIFERVRFMIILSVDYGDARTGVAVCDKSEMLASPVTVIKETYMPKVAAGIASVCAEKRAELVVVGCPVNMDGSFGARAEKCTELAEMLRTEHGLNVTTWDERMTTIEAHRALNETNTRGKKRKEVVDAVAATIILEDYLRYRKNCK